MIEKTFREFLEDCPSNWDREKLLQELSDYAFTRGFLPQKNIQDAIVEIVLLKREIQKLKEERK